MAQQHYKTLFKKALLQFIPEPDHFLAMLKWVDVKRLIDLRDKSACSLTSSRGRTGWLIRGESFHGLVEVLQPIAAAGESAMHLHQPLNCPTIGEHLRPLLRRYSY